jgi:hypothetical protein
MDWVLKPHGRISDLIGHACKLDYSPNVGFNWSITFILRLLVSDEGLRRSYPTAGADEFSTTLTLLDVIMGTLVEPYMDISINPTNVVCDEIAKMFGQLTKVGCFISCGITEKLLPWSNPIASPPPPDSDEEYGFTHATPPTPPRIPYTRYFRFDAMEERERLLAMPKLGKPLVASPQDWDIIPTLRFLSQRYMDLPEQKESVLECVDRLRGPSFKIRNRLFEGEKANAGDGDGFETGAVTSK